MKRRIAISAVLALVIVCSIIAYLFLNRSTITVSFNENINPAKTNVLVNGMRLSVKGDSKYYYKMVLSPGTHQLIVRSEGFMEVKQEIKTGYQDNVLVNVQLQRKSPEIAQETATKIYGDSNFTVSGSRFFDNDTWLVFFVAEINGSSDGSIVVAKKSAEQNNEWRIVAEGSDIDPSSDALSEAPVDLVNYLGGGL